LKQMPPDIKADCFWRFLPELQLRAATPFLTGLGGQGFQLPGPAARDAGWYHGKKHKKRCLKFRIQEGKNDGQGIYGA